MDTILNDTPLFDQLVTNHLLTLLNESPSPSHLAARQDANEVLSQADGNREIRTLGWLSEQVSCWNPNRWRCVVWSIKARQPSQFKPEILIDSLDLPLSGCLSFWMLLTN